MINRRFDLKNGDVVAIVGYRAGCGKTDLALTLAEQICEQQKTYVITKSRDFRVTEYGRFCLDEMGIPTNKFGIGQEPSEDIQVTIHDGVIPESATKIIYIVPTPLADTNLGINDKQHIDFCRQVRIRISDLSDAPVEFIEEHEIGLMHSRQSDLTQTDWIVIHELEKQLLAGTDVGNIRRFIREVKNKDWDYVHKF